jgi:hypothetical protein
MIICPCEMSCIDTDLLEAELDVQAGIVPPIDLVQQKKDDLYDLCQKFIDRSGITGEEDARQVAEVGPFQENAELIMDIAEIVGYASE